MIKLFDFLVLELFFRAVGWFFRTTGFLGALYLLVAVGVGLFVWAKVVSALGDTGAALSCTGVVLLLLGLFSFLHSRFIRNTLFGG